MKNSLRPFGDPWPSPIVPWGDPPWVMEGIAVTAWYETPIDYVRGLLSSAFEPVVGPSGGVPTRSRFYTISYAPRDGSAEMRSAQSGHFFEAVVAFTGKMARVPGEFSAYMWADDIRYRSWGRENFGWPLMSADFDFSGSIWQDGSGAGSCSVSDQDLKMTLTVDESEPQTLERGPAANWLTPRRLLFPGGTEPERRDLLVVRAEGVRPGSFTRRNGSLQISARPGSWAEGLKPIGEVDVHALVDFQIVVGHDVDTVREGA